MRRLVHLALLVVLLGATVVLWTQLFPPPERQIRRRIVQLQELLSFRASNGNLAALSDLRRLESFLTEDAELRVQVQGGRNYLFTGKESIVAAAGAVRRTTAGLRVEFLDVAVTLDVDRRSAVVEATGKVRQQGNDELWIEELRFRFIEVEGDWLISLVETVQTLTRAPPGPPGRARRAHTA